MKVLPFDADNCIESPKQNAVPVALIVGLAAVRVVIAFGADVALQPLTSVIVTV